MSCTIFTLWLFWTTILAPHNPFWTFKYFLLWLLVRFLVTLCLFYISDNFPNETTSILKGLLVSGYAKTTSKDSSLIFAWNDSCRVFISVLRYISSFAAVDVTLTHSNWYGQAFVAYNPYVTQHNSFRNLHSFDVYWWFYFYKICLYFLCVFLFTFTWVHAQGKYIFVQYIIGFDIKPNLASWSTLKVFKVLLPNRFSWPV